MDHHHANVAAVVVSAIGTSAAFQFPYTNRSNCRAAMKKFAAAHGLNVDKDLVITEHGARDFRFSRVVPFDDGIPSCLKIPQEVRNQAWAKNPPRTPSRPALTPKETEVKKAVKTPPNPRAAARERAGQVLAKEISRVAKKASAKKAGAKPARAPAAPKATKAPAKDGARSDGLRAGSKQAVMLDMVLSSDGATENAICAKLGWKKCRVTLKRVCDKVGAKLEQKRNVKQETVFFATMAKAA